METSGNAWDWVRDRFLDRGGVGGNSDPGGGILGNVSGAGGQPQLAAGLSFPGDDGSGAPDQNPIGFVGRALPGPPPAPVRPRPPPRPPYPRGDPGVEPET